MKIKSLSYILIESTNLESWEAYARDVVGLMKNDDLSDENNLFFRLDESPFRFQELSIHQFRVRTRCCTRLQQQRDCLLPLRAPSL